MFTQMNGSFHYKLTQGAGVNYFSHELESVERILNNYQKQPRFWFDGYKCDFLFINSTSVNISSRLLNKYKCNVFIF